MDVKPSRERATSDMIHGKSIWMHSVIFALLLPASCSSYTNQLVPGDLRSKSDIDNLYVPSDVVICAISCAHGNCDCGDRRAKLENLLYDKVSEKNLVSLFANSFPAKKQSVSTDQYIADVGRIASRLTGEDLSPIERRRMLLVSSVCLLHQQNKPDALKAMTLAKDLDEQNDWRVYFYLSMYYQMTADVENNHEKYRLKGIEIGGSEYPVSMYSSMYEEI